MGWGFRGSAETPGGRPWRCFADRAVSRLPSALTSSASESPVLPRGSQFLPGPLSHAHRGRPGRASYKLII